MTSVVAPRSRAGTHPVCVPSPTNSYRRANDKSRAQFNQAVFEQSPGRDGRIAHVRYLPAFDLLFCGAGVRLRKFGGRSRIRTCGLLGVSETL